MERILSQEDKIRRAEEIYQRRRANVSSGIRVSGDYVNSSKPRFSLFKKMALQLAICSVIYVIFYLIKNTNYIFSEDVMKKTKEMLSYDINFGKVYDSICTFWEENKNKFSGAGSNINTNTTDNTLESTNVNSVKNENTANTVENKNEINNESKNENENKDKNETKNEETVGIGGAETNEVEEASADESTEKKDKSQMEIDAEYVKEKYSFKLPLKGVITSRYGSREATEIVSANHKGIDIGANTGTAIYAAMEGTVSLVSSEGDYGKHVEIKNGEVITRYAHCSKIVVKEGAKIKQGQKIAEVGSTGRATGPHLHFEVIRNGRTINPEYILKF